MTEKTEDLRDVLAKAMCAVGARSKAATLEEVVEGVERWTRHRYEAERLMTELADYGVRLADLTTPQEGDARESVGRALYEAERAESPFGQHWISWEHLIEKDSEHPERGEKYGAEKYRRLADAAIAAFPVLSRAAAPEPEPAHEMFPGTTAALDALTIRKDAP